MINADINSNAQAWELEITCKNKEYLNQVVRAILQTGTINFQVENVEYNSTQDDWEGRYTVLIWSSWFSNLNNLTRDLAEIEEKLR